jgi:hypothetical protein
MKKTYIKPTTIEVCLHTEGMVALSMSGNTDQVWTNKKQVDCYWEEEETFEENPAEFW